MNNSSSDGSADEEEVMRNFDEEAKKIVQSETLPKKSAERYMLVYNTYKQWQEENRQSLSNSDENNLIVYFSILKEKLKPPTLWSIWSMLRKTLNSNENLNISNFFNLKILLKNNSKGYKPKKAFTLKWYQIMKFMTEAVDHTYLAMKVILIFGICGALRCDELTNMKFKDVENLGDKFLVSIHYNKNDYPGQFIIGNLFYNKVQQYISLRPTDQFSDRFFIQYHNGKCTRQAIGRHKIGEVPEHIASNLNLEHPERYTGHCFRRSAATLLSDSGANMQMIKQLGRWRSDMIAQGYIENSMHNRQMIYEGIITHQAPTNTLTNVNIKKPHEEAKSNGTTIEIPSTSTGVSNKQDGDNYILNWPDFSDDLNADDFTDAVLDNSFTTAGKSKIVTPPQPSAPSSSKLFLSKPPVKVNFNNQLTAQPPSVPSTSKQVLPLLKPVSNDLNNQESVQPPHKKRRDIMNSDHQDQNDKDINNRDVKFNNCTFNSCVFNITLCKCNNTS